MFKVEYNENTGRFLLTVPFDQNGVVRAMPGRRWMKRVKKWSVPAIRSNVETLRKLDAEWSPEALDACDVVESQMPRTEGRVFPAWYKFATEPYPKQLEAIKAGYGRPEFAYFMDMGTGKSKVMIDIWTALWLEGKITQILVICPVSIQDNWVDEFKAHCPIEFNAHVYRPQQHKKYEKWRDEVLPQTKMLLPVVIGGIESLSAGRAAKTLHDYALLGQTAIAVDESSRIKNADAKRSEEATSIGKRCAYRAILTGTSVTQGPLDLYSQFEFLNTHIFGLGDYYSFRNRYAIMGGYENKEIIGYDNLDELTETIGPFVFQCTIDEVTSLPEQTFVVRKVDASAEQRKLLKQIADGHAQVDDIEIEVKNVLEKLLRMQQVVNGFYTEYVIDPLTEMTDKPKKIPKFHNLKGNPKLRELEALCAELSHPAVIWAKYKQDLKNVTNMLGENYVEFHGGVPKEDRQSNVVAFQSGGGPKWFVGNPAAGGIGLTLTAARYMVYFSNSYSLEERLQSERRIHRIGQRAPTTYFDIIMRGTVDELALEAVREKRDIADWVRNKIKEIGSDRLLRGLTG